MAPIALTDAQRRDILQKEIDRYVRQHYQVLSQTDTTAQLVKSKSFSKWGCLLLFVSLPRYWLTKDKTVYLSVDAEGKLHKR